MLSSGEKIDFISKAKESGYFIRVFFVCTESPAINAARVATRYMSGGHAVPLEKIVNRYSKSIVNCSAIMKMVDRMYVYDNTEENREAKLLFRTVDGALFRQYVTVLPEWSSILLGN